VALPVELSDALSEWAAQSGSDLVTYDAERGVVRFKSDLLFQPGQDTLQPQAAEQLKALAQIFDSAAAANFDILIVGHTDDIPIKKAETKAKHPTNWYLSAHRAISVQSILGSSGVDENRIAVVGMGEFNPIAPNAAGQKGNPLNRRVEIYIVPAGSLRISK
jgi:chemotaxis protein MotB